MDGTATRLDYRSELILYIDVAFDLLITQRRPAKSWFHQLRGLREQRHLSRETCRLIQRAINHNRDVWLCEAFERLQNELEGGVR